MKKLATALVSAAAIMTMSTTAFAAENPAEVFDRVMEKNNTIQSAEIQSGVHSVILAKDVIPDGQMKVDMAMHAEMDMQDTTDLKTWHRSLPRFWDRTAITGFLYGRLLLRRCQRCQTEIPDAIRADHILRPDRSQHQQYGIQLYEGHFLKRGQWKTCAGI